MSRQQFALDRAVATAGGCLEWPVTDTAGYGRIGPRYMHRESYEVAYGAIPEGLQIDHLCRNRACVNPDHLEAVTQAENIRRGWAVRQTNRCKRDHDLNNPSNIYIRSDDGSRRCRACALFRAARRSQAKRSAA